MKSLWPFLCISIVVAPILPAADQSAGTKAPQKNASAEPSPAATTKAKADEPGPIVLKNKSSFNVELGTRSPFWPISWKPAGKVASGGTDQGEVPPGAFLVSTITLDGATRFAIINGRSMSEGQKFGLQIGTRVYQVEVKQIEDGRVTLTHGGEEIVVPLRRK